MVVSHDERLVSLCVNELWIVDSGKVCSFFFVVFLSSFFKKTLSLQVSPWEKDWDAYRKTLEKELTF